MKSFLRWALKRRRGYRVDFWPGLLNLQMRRQHGGAWVGMGRALSVYELGEDWRPIVAACLRQMRLELREASLQK